MDWGQISILRSVGGEILPCGCVFCKNIDGDKSIRLYSLMMEISLSLVNCGVDCAIDSEVKVVVLMKINLI